MRSAWLLIVIVGLIWLVCVGNQPRTVAVDSIDSRGAQPKPYFEGGSPQVTVQSSSQVEGHKPQQVTAQRLHDPVESRTRLSFHGYDCTVDCSGHEAGYEWAGIHGIDDPDDCGGNSDSFIEGCRSYAEEQIEEHEREPDIENEEESGEED